MPAVYHLPTFNLTANLWTGPIFLLPPAGAPRLTAVCQLRVYKTGLTVSLAGGLRPAVSILFPKGTDVRPGLGFGPGTGGDIIECPAGSGRFYECGAIEDVAKFFANEYRMAVCFQKGYVGLFPIS